MSDQKVRTAEVLAHMHQFPAILAFKDDTRITQAFDFLRDSASEITKKPNYNDHIGWTQLAPMLSATLKKAFPELAQENLPDKEYWENPEMDTLSEKGAALKDWVGNMEQKYGEYQSLPDGFANQFVFSAQKSPDVPSPFNPAP